MSSMILSKQIGNTDLPNFLGIFVNYCRELWHRQYLTICELDYDILQVEIQNAYKTNEAVELGEFCLVEDVLTNRWFRGRVQNHQKDLFDVFLIDHGNVLSVTASHLAKALDELFMLPPKIICGFFANVLPLRENWDSSSEKYFTSLIGSEMKGYVHALLPHKVLILEAPGINKDLFRLKLSFKPFRFKGFEDILLSSGPKITPGQRLNVRITAAVNPGSFYCQMASMVKDLKEMLDKLALYCESKRKVPTQKCADNLGLLCSVKGKDEKWHRGFVQFLPVNSKVRVLFVDYGFCESVKVDNVLQLPPDFLSTPIMAFPCALSCLAGQDEALKIQQMNCFKKGLLGGDLNVEINGFDQEQNLYSVTIFSAEDHAAVDAYSTQDVSEQKKCSLVCETEQTFPLNGYMYYETAIVQAMDNSVIVEEIQQHSVFEGYVEYVLNPGAFWLRTNKRNQDFEEMMKDIYKHFSQVKLDEGILENPEPGALCCAMHEMDMQYYRAIVTDTLDNGAEVFFIDFGNTEKVPYMFIKQIPDKFAIEPAFAFSCSLVNVVPFDDVWTISSINCFRQAVSNKTLLVHIVNITKARYVVDLYEKDFNASQSALKSITELLTTTKHAEYWKYPTSTPKGEMENILMNQKSCEKGKVNEKGSNTKVPISRTPINQAAAMKFKEVKFKPGSEIAVRCSHINTPSDFWCQMQNKIPNLEEMMDAIQQYYQKHSLPMQSGSTCVVKSEEDGRWYRACIIGAEKDEVEVIFVDYGKVAKVNMYHLQAIVPEFLELEGQAFRCSLYNLIEPAKGSCSDWGSEASNLLKEFAQGQSVKLTCNVHAQLYMKHKGLCNVVNLYNSDQNAVKKLVERGLAREVKTPIQLMPSVWPHSFVYSSFNLRCGNVEQVYVTHVCSPWEIYCQLDRNSEIIQDLMEKVAMESEQIQRAKFGPSIGKLCLAKYDEDGQWYRGVAYPIQETLLVNVFFVDYGNMRIVEKHNVMSIPRHSSDLLFTPMQALRCSLSHIKKAENVAEVNKWMEKSILNKTLKAIVVGKNDDGAVFLYMYDGDLNINKKVKELIGSQKPKEKKSSSGPVNGHKGQIEQMTNQTRITKDRKSLKPTRKKVSFCNQYKHQKQSSNAQKANSPKCPNSQKDLEDQRQGKESTEGIKRDVQTVFHTKLPNLSQLPTDPKLKSGFRGLGFVSHINNINSFFIQMQDDEENIVKIAEDLNSDLLGDVVRNNTTLVDLRIYDLVAAEFEEDGAIYRAVVRDYASSDHFKVEFIDYGNTATVTKDKIYTLTDVFLMQCRLSMPCTLLNSDSYKSDAAFVDAVMGKPLMVEVVSRFGAQWEVEIEVQQDNPAFKVHYDKSKKVTEHEVQTSCASLVDTNEQRPRGPGQENKSQSQNQRAMFTAQEEKVLLNVSPSPSPRPSPTKHKHDICLDQHNRKADSSITADLPVTSNELRSTSTERFVELVKKRAIPSQDIRAGRTESGTVLSVLENGEIHLKLHKSNEQFAELDNKCKITLEGNVKEGVQNLVKSTMKITAFECAEERPCPKNTTDVTQSVKEPGLNNGPQRLFLAPVNMDLGYSGFAAAVTTPDEFYIAVEEMLLIMNTVSTILKDLPRELSPLHEEHFISMSCCLVWSDSKNKWCRAEIVHFDKTQVVINLVDYGHCVCLHYNDRFQLRRLPDSLARLPKIAYPCTLRGIKPVKGQWTDEAVVFFQQCLCQKNLKIYFRQYISEAHLEADVIADGVYVAKNLVDAGHAEYTDIMLGLRFQEQTPIQIPQQKPYNPEQELTPSRMNTHPRRPTDDLKVDGSTEDDDASFGQGSEKAAENAAPAIENFDSQELKKMDISSTMTGERHCKYFHLQMLFFVLGLPSGNHTSELPVINVWLIDAWGCIK
uniref:Tudor domain-containing protein n=1 Tax=Esox lucius TaxID=8010 RepID=A0AAY5KJZ4_ESOLU